MCAGGNDAVKFMAPTGVKIGRSRADATTDDECGSHPSVSSDTSVVTVTLGLSDVSDARRTKSV